MESIQIPVWFWTFNVLFYYRFFFFFLFLNSVIFIKIPFKNKNLYSPLFKLIYEVAIFNGLLRVKQT